MFTFYPLLSFSGRAFWREGKGGRNGEREQKEEDEEERSVGRRGGERVREACVQNPQRFCNKCIDDNKNKNIKGRKDVFLC